MREFFSLLYLRKIKLAPHKKINTNYKDFGRKILHDKIFLRVTKIIDFYLRECNSQ